MYKLFVLKRYIEQILMFPFVFLGRVIAFLKNERTCYDIFFFIPIYGVGGAEYVNAKILDVIADRKVLLIFTRKSHEHTARHLFEHPNVTIIDISKWTDNKWMYWANFICRGYFATLIKRNKVKPIVFIGQCNFAYKLTPHLYRRYRVIELIHLFDKQFTYVWIPFVSFLDERLCVSQVEIEKILNTYKDAGIPEHYTRRMKVLKLYAEVPARFVKHSIGDGNMHVVYAGRGTAQKRLWLHFEVARRVKKMNLPIRFHYVGNFQDELPPDIEAIANYHLPIATGDDMFTFLSDKDILLLTSQSEGLPIILLESMYFGIVPVITPVGEMDKVIFNNENGIILNNESEEAVITSAVDALIILSNDVKLYNRLSENVKKTSYNFTKESFNTFITQVFSSSN